MTKIVLYSGGLDSFIGLYLLRQQSDDWTPVYFDMQLKYSQKERLNMINPIRLRIVDGMLDLSRLEHDNSAYVPNRNVLLCTAAQALYGASEIALCSVADDVYGDNSEHFHYYMQRTLSLAAGHQVRVFSPLSMWNGQLLQSKAEAVGTYLQQGGDPEMLRKTVSCYDPDELSCGKCKACTRRTDALAANGITL